MTKQCVICENEYVFAPDGNGRCSGNIKCSIGVNYCDECEDKIGLCKTCSNGYFSDKSRGCSISPNCQIYFLGKCLKYNSGYELIGDKEGVQLCQIIENEILKNCKIKNYQKGICDECEEGLYINSLDKKCSTTENFSISIYDQCYECSIGYYLNHKDCKKCKEQLSYKEKKFWQRKEIEDGETYSM